MAHLGFTFRKAEGTSARLDERRHACLVASDPQQDSVSVLILTVSSWRGRPGEDPTCRLGPDEWAWLRHPSYVVYQLSRRVRDDDIDRLHRAGLIEVLAPLPGETLKKILRGVRSSPRAPAWAKRLVQDQGLA